jgi:hypothetical protein
VDARTGGQDLRLIRRAIANGWNVPEDIKKAVVEEMARLVAGKNAEGQPVEVNSRNRIAAARVLVAADSVDARLETSDKPATQVNVSVTSAAQVSLEGLSDADLEALEAIQRRMADKQVAPTALPHVSQGESDGTPGTC